MNDVGAGKLMELVQESLRKARTEIAALNTRISVLEHRLNQMDLRISELPIGLEEIKAHIDMRFDAQEQSTLKIETLVRALAPAPKTEE